MIKRKQKQQHTTQSKRDSKCFFSDLNRLNTCYCVLTRLSQVRQKSKVRLKLQLISLSDEKKELHGKSKWDIQERREIIIC